jgi:hypothetical protein
MALRRRPSREQLAARSPGVVDHAFGAVVCISVVVGLPCFAVWRFGWAGAAVVAAVVALLTSGAVAARREAERRRRERAGDSICTFARAFPRRSVDTVAVRAVWNELLPCYSFPLRAGDRLLDDLGMDDIDLDVPWEELAWRCGRTLVDPEDNPWFGGVETVGDVVRFLSAQPRAA